MGQKVSPVGLRLGIIRGWDSNWYGGKQFASKIVEDDKIRKYLNAHERLSKAGIAKIYIERTLKLVTVTLFTARPGLIIGKGMSDSVQPHRQQPTRLLCPWDSPGKNTGCHFLLQCMHAC